jgi:hypothetical protein
MKRIIALLGWLAATGCSDLGLDVRSLTELERAEARWDRFEPESYVYAVQRICFCLVEETGPVRVRVEDGVAVEWTYVVTGDPLPEAARPRFPTVDGLFDILREAYAEDAYDVHVSYDPDLGYPTEFSIDYEEQVADEELGMRVTQEPLAIPLLVLAPPTA